MTERGKERLGSLAALGTVVISIIIMAAFYLGSTGILWFLAIFNLISGPVCLIMYLREANLPIRMKNKSY